MFHFKAFGRKLKNGSSQSAEKDDGRRTAVSLTAAIILLYIILSLLINFFGINKNNIEAEKLDDLLTVDIIHEDQTTTSYSGNAFNPPKKTDNVYVEVPLPKSRRVSSPMLCFSFYNAKIQIFSSNNQLIYSNSSADMSAAKTTGHMLIQMVIPNDCWGKSIHIKIIPLKNHTTSVINGVYVINSSQSAWYPVLLNGQFMLFLILFVFIGGLLLLSLFITMRIRGSNVTDGIILMLFTTTGCVWALCYTGLMYMCSGNSWLCAFGEYYAVYLTMPFLTAYFRLQAKSRALKRFFSILTAGLTFLALLVYVGEINNLSVNTISMIQIFRLILILVVICCTLPLFRQKDRMDAPHAVQMIGIVITFILVILEIVRSAYVSFAGESINNVRSIAEMNFTMPICIVLISTLLISYLSNLMKTRQVEQENKTLKNLAHFDALTGVPNRLYLRNAIDSLEENEVHEYALFFMDANNLKKANDEYGHETGDKLLKLIGQALREASEGIDGFFGRFGGDEFISCVYSVSSADKFENRFFDIIAKANKEKYLPFDVSVAIGKVIHEKEDSRNSKEILKAADDLMYKNKAAMKGEKNVR